MARGRRTPARQARRERTSARDQALAAGRADLCTLCASARAFEWRLACKGAGEQGGPGGGTPPGCGSVLRVPAAA